MWVFFCFIVPNLKNIPSFDCQKVIYWAPSAPAITDKNGSYLLDVLGVGKGGEPQDLDLPQLKNPSSFF